MSLLLDTNTVIAWTYGRNRPLMARLKERRQECLLSSVVIFELSFGAFKSAQVAANLALIEELTFTRLVFDPVDARAAAEIRDELRRAGMPIGLYDLLIAGQARGRGLTVVTNNVREFSRVEGLAVEDWTV